MAIAGFNPADAVVGHQKTHQMAITKAGDERGTMAIAIITADVTRGGKALLLQAVGRGPQAQHEILNNRSVVLSKTRKHRPPSKE